MLGTMDLMTTMMTLKMNPMMRPRSTSTKTVDKNVTIHKTPSHLDLDQNFFTSPNFLKQIKDSGASAYFAWYF